MPNHVTHKITFAAEHAERVFAVCPDGLLSFNMLVPEPPHVYHGGLTPADKEDFTINWYEWSQENWGTKWPAYNGKVSVEGDRAVIMFDTAWSIPYPVIAAFCNRFQIPFEHRYFDEFSNYWGIETWGTGLFSGECVQRISKRWSLPEDYKPLCQELKGYDPDEDDIEQD